MKRERQRTAHTKISTSPCENLGFVVRYFIFRFEKMISGMYLGELVRQCILHLIKSHILFKGKISDEMGTKYSFLTKHVSDFCRYVDEFF